MMIAPPFENPIAPAPVAGNAPHGRAPSVYPAMAREKAHKAQDMRNRDGYTRIIFRRLRDSFPAKRLIKVTQK